MVKSTVHPYPTHGTYLPGRGRPAGPLPHVAAVLVGSPGAGPPEGPPPRGAHYLPQVAVALPLPLPPLRLPSVLPPFVPPSPLSPSVLPPASLVPLLLLLLRRLRRAGGSEGREEAVRGGRQRRVLRHLLQEQLPLVRLVGQRDVVDEAICNTSDTQSHSTQLQQHIKVNELLTTLRNLRALNGC